MIPPYDVNIIHISSEKNTKQKDVIKKTHLGEL